VIHVFSRHAVEAIAPFDEPHVFISIRSPWDDKPARLRVNEHTIGVLHMAFHDLDCMPTPAELKVSYHIDAHDLFNAKMARELLAFMRTHVLGKSLRPEIVIHCDGGWSRSAAVAAGLEATILTATTPNGSGARRPTCASTAPSGTRSTTNRRVANAARSARTQGARASARQARNETGSS